MQIHQNQVISFEVNLALDSLNDTNTLQYVNQLVNAFKQKPANAYKTIIQKFLNNIRKLPINIQDFHLLKNMLCIVKTNEQFINGLLPSLEKYILEKQNLLNSFCEQARMRGTQINSIDMSSSCVNLGQKQNNLPNIIKNQYSQQQNCKNQNNESDNQLKIQLTTQQCQQIEQQQINKLKCSQKLYIHDLFTKTAHKQTNQDDLFLKYYSQVLDENVPKKHIYQKSRNAYNKNQRLQKLQTTMDVIPGVYKSQHQYAQGKSQVYNNQNTLSTSIMRDNFKTQTFKSQQENQVTSVHNLLQSNIIGDIKDKIVYAEYLIVQILFLNKSVVKNKMIEQQQKLQQIQNIHDQNIGFQQQILKYLIQMLRRSTNKQQLIKQDLIIKCLDQNDYEKDNTFAKYGQIIQKINVLKLSLQKCMIRKQILNQQSTMLYKKLQLHKMLQNSNHFK